MTGFRFLLVSAALTAAIVWALPVGGAYGMGGACSSGQVMKTKSYVFALSIGPVEEMYTQAQVKAKHPKTGEVMLSGTMGSMNMSSSSIHHLEVHICTSGGAVVTGAHPTITIDDPTAKTMMMSVPIATMEGIGMGMSDYHYGNNIDVPSGHHITVTVKLNGEQVVFHTTVSKSAMSMSG